MEKTNKTRLILIVFIIAHLLNTSIVFSQNTLLSKDERNFLKKLGQIQVLVDDNFPPISYFDNENNDYGGIAVEVIRQLSEILDFEYRIIRDESLTWNDKLKMIENNQVHLLGGASINDERGKYSYFTEKAYFETNYAIIGSVDNHKTIRDLSDIGKYRIGLIRETGINELILASVATGTSIKYYETMDQALLSLKNNEIDLITDNEAVFIDEYFNNQRFDFEVLYSIYSRIKQYAYMTPKTEEGLKLSKILDKGLKEIDIDSIVDDRYQNKSIFKYYKEYSEELRQVNIVKNFLLVGLAFVVSIILGIIGVIRIRNKELTALARTDNLTKLGNRNALFEDYKKREKLNAKRVYFIDLDDFKFINDNYGHDAGDEVLKGLAKRLLEFTPKSDIYRMGGDEFLLISENSEENFGEKLISIIQEPIIYEKKECKVHGSIGYLETSDFVELDLHEIINLADYAMLEAKAAGKNNILKVNTGMIDRFRTLLGKKI